MESGHKSAAGGASGGDGVLCHACGYQYPNGHPSAKQRRAHRKHCGKPASAATAAVQEGAGEHDGSESLPGGAGGGIGASAVDCGGGLPGSAPEAASAADGGDNNAEHSSGNGTGHQVIGDECAEDPLISSSSIPSEITSEASRTDDDTLTTVATQHSKKGTPMEDRDPSDPALGSEQLKDVPASVLAPEPEDGAKCSSEISEHEKQYSEKGTPMEEGDPSDPELGSEQLKDIPASVLLPEPEDGAKCSSEISEHEKQNLLSEYETQNSTVDDGTLESNATGGGASGQPDDVISKVDGTAVTEEDDTINTIGKNKFSEDKSIDGDDFDLCCQENLHTKIGEGHSSIAVVEESSDKNPSVNSKEILSEEAESNQQSKHMITDSLENIANIDNVPVESSTEKPVGTEDDMLKLGTVGSHSETPDVKPQQQLDSTSETEGHLAVSEAADNVDEHHYPISEGGIPALSSAFGPAVTANVSEHICSSGVPTDGSMQQNVIGDTVVTSHVDIVELSTPVMSHEISMVASTDNVEENRQNEKDGTDLASYGGNELHVVENFEEKQENKEVTVDPSPHEADTVSSVVESMSSAEEKEQIEESIANLAPEVTSVTSSRDIVEEKQGENNVKSSGEIDGARSIETAGENNSATSEINAGASTDDVEDKVQNEEFTMDPISDGINMICSSSNEGKIRDEEVTKSLGFHESIVVHGTDNAEEKMIEEAMADATSHKFSLVTSTDSVEERKDEETTADPTWLERSAVHTIDDADERKNKEPILDPSPTTDTMCSIGDVEEKKHNEEETTADPGESNALPGTEDAKAENKKQNGDIAATGSASDKTEVAQTTNDVEEIGKTEDVASKEISAIESTDDLRVAADQNEEIADKEMVMDSDKNHVSLKVLLADKNVETKEKEKKANTKDRVLSFRRRTSKDSASPVKPGSPKAGSGQQQDWNSPARLPVEKKPKGRKQQWVPFICCSSVQ